MYEDLINIMFKNPIQISEEDIYKYFDLKYDYQDDFLQRFFNHQKKEESNE